MAIPQTSITLETALAWAKSGRESNKVYRFLFLHPDDFFTIPKEKKWSIAHQVVYNGDVSLLGRILALFYDDQIQIRTLSGDQKTLLDVAKDRQKYHPEMYNYVEQLFLRDDLIQAAKTNNWRLVSEILQNNPRLANEKPPYSTFFLLHYIVQNGDTRILEDLFHRFQFDTNVFSVDLETPLDLARRLKRHDMCSIFEPTTKERLSSDLIKYRAAASSTNAKPVSSELPYPAIDPFPTVDFHHTSIIITQAGDYQLEKKSLFSTIPTGLSKSEHINKTEVIDNQFLAPNSEPLPTTPVTPTSQSQLLRNLTCPLTQEIFVDPVIASDGQTYERAAIMKWIEKYECSPMTGLRMDPTFTDNIEIKQIIQSMRK